MRGRGRAINSGVIKVRSSFPALVLDEALGRGCIGRGGPGLGTEHPTWVVWGKEVWTMRWKRSLVSERPQEPEGKEGGMEDC